MNGNQEERALNILEQAGLLGSKEATLIRMELEHRRKIEIEDENRMASAIGMPLVDAAGKEIGRVFSEKENQYDISKITINAEELGRFGFKLYIHHRKGASSQGSLVYVGEPDEGAFWTRLR